MNLLFLTLHKINSIDERGIFSDLLRSIRNKGHNVYIIRPNERRDEVLPPITIKDNVTIINVRTLNITNCNIIEKGFSTLLIELQYLSAIKKYLPEIKFDALVYSTPPITFSSIIKYIKSINSSTVTYLLLKDIFPQNAVDLNFIKKNGLLHKYFKYKEKKLYLLSDYIGCMSIANKDFLIKNYSFLNPDTIEVNPNSIFPLIFEQNETSINEIRTKYGIPTNKKVFTYAGNLGKPQGLDFLIQTIDQCKFENVFYLIVGEGTEFFKIDKWIKTNSPDNALLLSKLPKNNFDELLSACDFGFIFLHKNFTIPNFPSRLLSYLEMKMPVIAATDIVSDVGDLIESYSCGYKVITGDIEVMKKSIYNLANDLNTFEKKSNCTRLLTEEFSVEKSARLILEKIKK
jgi:glycosyltransferase involved in cell wall biosynthesis